MELAQICIPSLERYCEKHKYDSFIKCTSENKKGWYGFINTRLGGELLEQYDLVLMMEGDFLITNHNIPITDFIDDEHDFFICKDVNGVNGGSWIVKNTFEGKEWLDYVNSFEPFFEHEQTVFENDCNLYDSIKILPHPSINSVPYSPYYKPSYGKIGYKEGEVIEPPTEQEGQWTPNNLTMHLPGMTLERRKEIFKNHFKDIIYE